MNELVDLLDRVVREQLGNSPADKMHRIRSLSLERRSGFPEAGGKLVKEFEDLNHEQIESIIRWLSLFFDLANLSEEKQRIDILQQREEKAAQKGKKRAESVGATIQQLCESGLTANEMQDWLNKLKIEPVFTAHPSEAKRRTIRQLLRQIRSFIPSTDNGLSEQAREELLTDLTILWQSDFFRPGPPPVMNEVSRGVYFVSTLWDVVPRTFHEMRSALEAAYPQHQFELPQFLTFGSWIGGDRDGHPFVTADVTRQSLTRLRREAIQSHISECQKLFSQIVVSEQQVPANPLLKEAVDALNQSSPEFAEAIGHVSDTETYRRFIKLMEFRLSRTFKSNTEHGYPSPDDFVDQLMQLKESLESNRGERIVERLVQPWVDLAKTFGFHFARLDIRQNSERHRQCIQEILQVTGANADTDLSMLSAEQLTPPDPEALSPDAREVFETFLLIADELRVPGSQSIGCYIISMTHSAEDVFIVLRLWQLAWIHRHGSLDGLPSLPIVPLFETIDDLRSSPAILSEILEAPVYRDYQRSNSVTEQLVMVGYSDSTKDGGYLAACWELHKAQVSLEKVASKNGIKLNVFHGRGGALGRGGGPAARAIQSLPPKAVNGYFRVTEQGEVLSERYDDPDIAHRHLEQLICATLSVSASKDEGLSDKWDSDLEDMSCAAQAVYCEFIEQEGFLEYFDQCTPINEIETLPIGSRPARRGKRNSLDDLRAIPWTFAWTQSRHLLPAWYGLGTAFGDFAGKSGHDWEGLQTMYQQWPMFRALIDNAELALAKTDMDIAKFYADLSDEPHNEKIWEMISSEYARSQGAILMIKNQRELLEGIGWLRRSVMKRNPYVDPLNLLQVKLIKELRADPENNSLLKLIRLTIQGIAAGLRTTG